MDLEARPLRCFIAVAEHRSFSRAAERLRLTQPSVSAQIRELERIIGFDLFERSTRRVELSERGLQFLGNARRMIDETDRLKRAISSLRHHGRGRVSVGAAFFTVDFPERIALLDKFIATHPDVAIDIEMRWQAELLRDLHKGKIGLVLTLGIPVPRSDLHALAARRRGTEGLFADDLRRIVLRSEPIALLVPEESPMAACEVVEPWMLSGQTVATLTHSFGDPIVQPINHALELAGATPFVPPESTAIGVARYGCRFRIPAISIGWFDGHLLQDARMVKRSLANLDLKTEFVLVRNNEPAGNAVESFWKVAEDFYGSTKSLSDPSLASP